MATAIRQSYIARIHISAKRELEACPIDIQHELKDKIIQASELQEPSSHSDIRLLRGCNGLFRVRAGDFRAICDLVSPTLRVLLVDRRSRVYDRVDEAKARGQ